MLALKKVKAVVSTPLIEALMWARAMYGKVNVKSTWVPFPVAVAGL
jgi:hypothetical protein